MSKQYILPVLILSIFVLSACQPAQPPERPINTGDRPRVTREKTPPAEEVLPVLAITKGENKSELKLRSQTARYLNNEKTALEIVLTSSNLAYCQNESPALGEGEEELKIVVKTVDGKFSVGQGELATEPGYELSGTYRTSQGDVALEKSAISSLNITDLNAAIVRGHLKIAGTDLAIEGEFFTAICR